MSANLEIQATELKGLQSILIIGCGLIGTSIALGLKKVMPELRIDGVESFDANRQVADRTGVFGTIYADLPHHVYDLAVIATPVDVAKNMILEVSLHALTIMDVCSVKQAVCETADEHGLRDRFAPTHPMAGASESGPMHASADLFEQSIWLCVTGWPMCAVLAPMLEALGARVEYVDSPSAHDAAMAVVSHGIHVTSVAAMLTYHHLQRDGQGEWNRWTGPGFRDVTRLSAAGSAFWASTLMENRLHVIDYLSALRGQLDLFQQALEEHDDDALIELLQSSRSAQRRWRGARP
jgi:prephenate dehydrogenase